MAHPRRNYSHDGARMIETALRHFVRFLSTPALVATLGVALTACPRPPDAPEPLMGTPCEQLTDCNPGRECGALKLCVDGFCEADASLLRPCRDEGQPVRPPSP